MAKKPSRKNNFFAYPAVKFLKELGSDSSSPGGGAAAALTGAIGVSLVEMVARINERRIQKKLGQKKNSQGFKAKLAALIRIRSKFGALMKSDTEAFLRLSGFSKEKRTTPAYEKALKAAAGVPLEMAHLSYQAMAVGEAEIDRTSRWLASDLAEAGILLEASFQSARLNVEINLRSIQDNHYLGRMEDELKELDKKVSSLKSRLLGVLSRD